MFSLVCNGLFELLSLQLIALGKRGDVLKQLIPDQVSHAICVVEQEGDIDTYGEVIRFGGLGGAQK